LILFIATMTELVAVTIPIYKETIDEDELISLTQCLKILKRYPIIFFAPKSLNISYYENFCAGKIDFRIKRFDDEYFLSIDSYNKLMLSVGFYYRFKDYKFILIYQLDAFVFRDELDYWCKKNYDYIGAPYLFVDLDKYPISILTKYRKFLRILNKLKIITYTYRHVGNGGFSLRNIRKTILFLKIFRNKSKKWQLNEDSLFTHYGNLIFPVYKLAPEKEALNFAFESEPAEAYKINLQQLPFGCHAFSKPENKKFWKKLINLS
jgi:Protein of unknown function (DUF5672)